MTRTIYRERLRPVSPRLGRHVHHDSESRRYAFDTTGLTIKSVRHQRHVPVFDQGDLGDCVANAGLGCLATGPFWATWQALARQPYPMTNPGVTSNYIDLTAMDDAPGYYKPGDPNSQDTGSDGLSEAKLLKSKGVIAGYQHTFTLDDALKALQVVPAIVGTVWLDAMFEPNPLGLVSVTGAEQGGHEYVMDEYDEQRGWVGFTNSWGVGFGVQGRFYMQAEDFGNLLHRDGDVTVFTPLTRPAPQPAPQPASPDAALAATLHQWLAKPSQQYRTVRQAAQTWLDARGL